MKPKTCLTVRSKVGVLLALLTLSSAWSCSPSPHTARLKSAADFFAALFNSTAETEKVKLQISSPNDVKISLCVTKPSAGCAADSEKIPLLKINNLGDRFIHAAEGDILPSATKDYLVLDQAGLNLFRFRMKPVGSTNQNLLATGLAEFHIQNLKDELKFLTDDKYKGRLSATAENNEIGDWLIEHLKKLNIKPAFGDEYRQKFRLGVGPTANGIASNIIGLIEGSDPVLKNEYIVIGAHMDHAGSLSLGYTCGMGSLPGDSICNGADDNGSGTIALLNISKALAASRTALKRSVLIMWFSGEEEGLIGSKYYIANPVVPLKNHVYMINLDMVGYGKSNGQAISALGFNTSKTGETLITELGKKYTNYTLRTIKEIDGGSDHAPFMNKGIPGVFYHTGVKNNTNYHKTSDHVDFIDYEGMLTTAKISYETVMGMATVATVDVPMSLVDGTRPKFVSDFAATQGCHYLMNYSK